MTARSKILPLNGNSEPSANQPESIDWCSEFESSQHWLRKVLQCRIRDHAAVEDCLQEIAVAIFRQSNKPLDPDKVPAWLYRLAVRQAITFHRKNGRRSKFLDHLQQNGNHHGGRQTADTLDVLEKIVHNESLDVVKRSIDELDSQDREILMLKYSENWSYKDLATRLGVSETTIEYRLVRAKKRLRKILAFHQD